MRTGVRLRTARPLPMQYQSASALLTKYREKQTIKSQWISCDCSQTWFCYPPHRDGREGPTGSATNKKHLGQTPQQKNNVKDGCWLMILTASVLQMCVGVRMNDMKHEGSVFNRRWTQTDHKLTGNQSPIITPTPESCCHLPNGTLISQNKQTKKGGALAALFLVLQLIG